MVALNESDISVEKILEENSQFSIYVIVTSEIGCMNLTQVQISK